MSQFNKIFQLLKEKIEIGLVEKLTLFFPNKDNPVLSNILAKSDSGNSGCNVLHGIIIEQDNNVVKFRTVNNKVLTMKKEGEIVIHIGSGNKEARPVVKFDIVLGNKGEKPIKLTNNDVEINKGDNNVVFTIKSNDATKKISSDVTIKFITKNTVSTLVLDERKREILKVLDLRFDAKYLDYEVGNNTKLYNDLEQGGVTVEVIGKTGIKEKSVIKVK